MGACPSAIAAVVVKQDGGRACWAGEESGGEKQRERRKSWQNSLSRISSLIFY